MTQPGSEAAVPRWIQHKRTVRLFKFLVAGLPSLVLAVPANYLLVGYLGLAKPLAYAIILAGQVTLNCFLSRVFVFQKRDDSILRQSILFVAGILGFRVVDWLVYVLLVDVFGLYYLVVQIGNILAFSLPKFVFAERVFAARRERGLAVLETNSVREVIPVDGRGA